MEFAIRQAKPADAPAMYDVSLKAHRLRYAGLIPQAHRQRFDAYYTFSPKKKVAYVATIRHRLAVEGWYGWVAEAKGRIVGFTLAKREGKGLILKRGLFVAPDFEGKGVGKALFKASVSIAKHGDIVRLKVVENNTRARRLYEAHGFSVRGYAEEPFYGARQVIMERQVD